MEARKMFEELNLEQIRNDDNYIEYVRNDLGGYISILFSLRWKSIKSTHGYQARGTNYHEIPLDELKAIIQQAKELGWFEEEKRETNFEHFKNEIKDKQFDFAIIDGKVLQCKGCLCNECLFHSSNGTCDVMKIKWLYKWHKKKYKLTQFEYDLLSSCAKGYKFKDISPLIVMKEKGYFKDVSKGAKIDDVLANCEVIQ